MCKYLYLTLVLSTLIIPIIGQNTVGLTTYSQENTDGYILFSGISSKETYLIDKCGEKVHQWSSSYRPGLSVDLLPDGRLFRTCSITSPWFGSGSGKGGFLEIYDWNGNVLWNYQISDSLYCQHHDAKVLPNGNVLIVAWANKAFAEATQAGKDTSVTVNLNGQSVWSESIIELAPIGIDSAEIVWQWNAWDHLIQDFDATKDNYGIISAHPELLNINYVSPGPPSNPDWLHINSIDYNSFTDEIVLSVHGFSEFWILDHSTSTLEAAGHTGGNSGKGGDVLYRWGNPQTYDRGGTSDQKLFKQHHATFIKQGFPNEGKILVFNNGQGRTGGDYSSIDMVDISEAGYPYSIDQTNPFAPDDMFWTYESPDPLDFYAPNISGAFALQNGGFLFTNGPKGEFLEINETSEVVWTYINPTNNTVIMTQGDSPSLNTVFRAQFYPLNYGAFIGQDLTPQGPIELDPTMPSLCQTALIKKIEDTDSEASTIYPNPIKSGEMLFVRNPHHPISGVKIYNSSGTKLLESQVHNSLITIDTQNINPGTYIVEVNGNGVPEFFKVIIEK